MNLKTLRPVAAALVIASLAPAAFAETLGNHPAVQVANTWATRGIDVNTFIVGHPAGTLLVSAAVDTPSQPKATTRPVDAQAQAAALLNPPVVSGTSEENRQARPSSVAKDAQASAAALLSGTRARTETTERHQLSDTRTTGDAQAQAAALLSGSRVQEDERPAVELSSKVGF